MKVLVTGCCGFLGSHLCRDIIKRTNWTVIGIDNLSYCSSLKNIEDINKSRFMFIKADFCDKEFMHYIFSVNKFDIVFHIGAFTHVDNSFDNSVMFSRNNVYGTHVLLQLAHKFKIPKFIHMSTDEVYGSIPDNEFADESYPFNPTNPYSTTKVCAELLAKSYKDNYGLNIIIIRGNNIIGTHQFVEKVVPKFIMRLLKLEKCCIHGNGLMTRNFTAVDDMTRAIILIANESEQNEIWNVGNIKKYTIVDTAKMIIEEMKKPIYHQYLTKDQIEHLQRDDLIEYVEDRIFNDIRYDMNIGKIKNKLGFEPQYSFEDQLPKIVEWYLSHQDYFNDLNIDKYIKPHCR